MVSPPQAGLTVCRLFSAGAGGAAAGNREGASELVACALRHKQNIAGAICVTTAQTRQKQLVARRPMVTAVLPLFARTQQPLYPLCSRKRPQKRGNKGFPARKSAGEVVRGSNAATRLGWRTPSRRQKGTPKFSPSWPVLVSRPARIVKNRVGTVSNRLLFKFDPSRHKPAADP